MEYKKTLNMTKSGFPMRAGLPKREPEMLKHWEELDLYHELLKKNEGKPRFALHDGPPFSNGALHMGHALNKSIKDFNTRSYAMRGYYTPYIPGWDNHGMPIESAIIKQNKLNRKAMGVAEFRSACHEFADHYIDVQRQGFKRMGVVGDWDHPYKTMDPAFEAQEVRVFGKMYEKGYIYKGLKPVYWCPHDETALAEAEIEYQDDPCTTVYVKFPMYDDLGKLSHLDKSKLNFVIWTTTIWTLPGNLAIALHPQEEYAVVRADGGEMYIMARPLVEKVMKIGGVEHYEIVETHPGAFFENMLASHPFLPKTSRLVLADYVTMDSGTGCVHTAPGFGADDYQTCRRYDMELVVPVDDRGYQTKEAGKYAGMYYAESNGAILADMKESGALFASEEMVHSYPHCWRTDKPVLYYPLDSWFIRTTALRERMIELNKTIRWKPESTGTGRFGKWLEGLVDWNLSRSRFWGTPLPVWATEDYSELKCIGSIRELMDEIEKSIAAGFMKENPYKNFKVGDMSKENYSTRNIDLHRPYVDNIVLVSSKGEPMKRESDLIDVWFDSGAMPYAQLHYPFENGGDYFKSVYPADFIAEGVDQTRGWFFTLHAIASMLFDSVAFKNIISNGLVLDKNGNKMSKRLGNGVDPFEVLATYGADATRWYMISNSQPWDNLKFDRDGVDEVRRKFFGTLYNTYSFFALYANVDGFTGKEPEVPVEKRPEIDRWIISLLNTLVKEVTRSLEDYDPTPAARAIQEFVGENLSNWYVRLNRKRFWGGGMNDDKLAAYQTLYTCLETVSMLAAPFAPFITDRIFRDLNAVSGRHADESVHLSTFPKADEKLIDTDLEEMMSLAQRVSSMVLALRRKVSIKVRQPLTKILIPVLDPAMAQHISAVKNLIMNEVNVKEVELIEDTTGIITKRIKPNFKTLGPRYGKYMKQIAAMTAEFSQERIAQIEAAAQTVLDLGAEKITVTPADFEITSEDMPGWLVASEGKLTVALDITLTEELRAEGVARELINRIQNIRKDSGFEVTDKIRVEIEQKEFVAGAIAKYAGYIASQTLAVEVKAAAQPEGGVVVDSDVDDEPIRIAVTRI